MDLHTLVCVGLWVLLVLGAASAAAQDITGTVPRNEDAELIFSQALDAFDEGDYGMAYRRFRLVWSDFPLHRKTTAAQVMGAKALYRQGEYEQALTLLNRFLEAFPTSSYQEEARRLLQLAEQGREQAADQRRRIQVGVLLPMGSDTTSLTQELFNGIHLAVEEFNRVNEGTSARMVFRGIGARNSVADAVSALVQERVDVIIGPLYSETALEAGRAAEQARIVLVAPLATDEAVSEGQSYVFQANPTITMRGRQLAQFAANSLRLTSVGLVADRSNSISERMAQGFEEEARRIGLDLRYAKRLNGSQGWYDLPTVLGADTVSSTEGLYLPISGSNAEQFIGAALTSLDRMNVNTRVLGNSEWHDLPIKQQASRYQTTYANDFYVDEANGAVRTFREQYQQLAGERPGRLAYTGYDLTRFLLATLQDAPNRSLRTLLHEAPQYDGLGLRFEFGEGNVNRAMFYHRYRLGQVDLLR